MKQALRNFSNLLQLRPEGIHSYLSSHDAAQALKLLTVVGLFAGLGILLGIPNALRQLTIPEQIDIAAAAIQDTSLQVVAAVVPVLAEAQSVSEVVVNGVTEAVRAVADRVNGVVATVTGWVDTGRAQIDQNAQVQQLLQQSTVTVQQIEQVAGQAQLTAEEMGTLLARAKVTAEQATSIMQQAGLGAEQIAQAQAVRSRIESQVGAVAATAAATLDSAMAQLQPLIDQLGMTQKQFQEILAQLSTTPEQFNRILQRLSLAPEAIGELIKQVEATPEQLARFAADVRAEAVKAEPPIGTRASRVVHLFGQWLSVPLRMINDWLAFALVLLVVTKLLGGRAPLPKHLAAVALAAAPLVLLAGNYIPDMTGAVSLSMATAIDYFGRVLGLIGVVWAALLMLRTVSEAHEISLWRSAGALALTLVAIYVLLPLAGLLLANYLLTA